MMENNLVSPARIVAMANYASLPLGAHIGPVEVASRMLLWCRGGHGTVTVNGQNFELGAGDFLFMPWLHRIEYRNDGDGTWELAGIHLVVGTRTEDGAEFQVCHEAECRTAWNPVHADGELVGFDVTLAGQLAAVPQLELLLDYCVAWYGAPGREFATAHWLAQLLLRELCRWRENGMGDAPQMPIHFRRLLERARRRMAGTLEIDELCRMAHCGRATLFRHFRCYLRQTPNQWLTAERLKAGAILLSRTTRSMAEIADAVGINDPNYFAKVFKKTYGVTPGAYRRRHALLTGV